MEKVFLLLGGNVGNVSETFNAAKKQIIKTIGPITTQSSLYKTEPWGNKKQDFFLNQVLIVETELPANAILQQILFIESNLGRKREEKNRFAARNIDIDILFYGTKIINEENLIVPHPRLHLRNFVLTPLMEVAPEMMHPLLHKKVIEIFEINQDKSDVQKL